MENYPPFTSIDGSELMKRMEEHVKANGVEIKDDIISSVNKEGELFVAKSFLTTYKAKALIVATGGEHRRLNVPGEKEYYGRGVSYCATCDGAFFKDKVVGVVGGGDSAAKEALVLTQYASRVYVIYRGKRLKAEPINRKRLESNDKVEIVYERNVVEVLGDGEKVVGVRLDKPYNDEEVLQLQGLFIEIGQVPQNDIVKPLGVSLNAKGEIVVNAAMETNVPGVFAAGDNVESPFKQAIVSAGQGAIAAHSAFQYLQRLAQSVNDQA